jgi:hypothetical protein
VMTQVDRGLTIVSRFDSADHPLALMKLIKNLGRHTGTDMRSLRFWPGDPRRLQRSFFSDDRFCLAHQVDWYESTILPKGRITTEMKWVDWSFLLDLPAPIEEVIHSIHTCCQYMGIAYLMGLRSDYSQGWWHNSMPHFMLIEMRMRCTSLFVGSDTKSLLVNLLLFSNLEVPPLQIDSLVNFSDFIVKMS